MPPVGPRPAPPVGTVKMQLIAQQSGVFMENVFWLLIGGTPTYAQLGTAAIAFKDEWDTLFNPYLSTAHVSEECRLTFYDGGGDPQGSYTNPAGGAVGSSLPNSNALVLQWRIASTYRGGKPRTYIGGCPFTEISDDRTWAAAYAANLQSAGAAWQTFCNAFTADGFVSSSLGTVSFQHANAWRTPPIFRPYVGIGVQQRICSQRRRLGALIS